MADYLKSAFNYLSSAASAPKLDHEFVGGSIRLGNLSVRIKRTIAEGGYGVVYEAHDSSKGISYALKRMISQGKENDEVIRREIAYLKQLNGHPNIMQFHQAASLSSEKSKSSRTEFLILTEFCKGGQLTQYLPIPRQERPFSVNVILQIMHQTCRAVQHMHDQCPPIIHRDLKIENLLLSHDFVIKLCDFGSATTVTYEPDASWTALKRLTVQEELDKFTTPMYRPPEILDLYLNYPIGMSLDIWALGCILFYLCCTHHPFEDSAKLAILNANYVLSTASPDHSVLHNLIRQMLLIDPRQRPTVTDVLNELSEIASSREVRVSGPIPLIQEVQNRRAATAQRDPVATPTVLSNPQVVGVKPTETRNKSPCPPSRPPAPQGPSAVRPSEPKEVPPSFNIPTSAPVESSHPAQSAQVCVTSAPSAPTASNMFGMFKDGAGHFIKNLRDASSKVLETVSATLSGELDFQLITSRIAVMRLPTEPGREAVFSSRVLEEAQSFLDANYPNSYAVYNLSPRSYRSDTWFEGRVSHRMFEHHRAPPLRCLVELCLNARLWLHQNPANLCVVHCADGRVASAVLVCSLLCFCHLFDNASPALQLFSLKRGNPRLTASQIRYIDYVAQLAHGRVPMPHRRPLQLIKLTVAPIPTFNKSKTGCRPYVEIYEGKVQIFSSFSSFETLRSYVLEDGKIEFTFNGISVMGDLTVIVYHCRSSFTGRGKVAAVKMAQFQLYTGMIEPNQTELIYFRSDLDHLDVASSFSNFFSRYADSFHLTLEFMVSPTERPRQSSQLVSPWDTFPSADLLRPTLCVSSNLELKELLADFGRFNITRPETNGTRAVPHTVKQPATPEVSRRDEAVPKSKPESQLDHPTEVNHPTPGHVVPDEHNSAVADLLGFSTAPSASATVESVRASSPPTPVLIDISEPTVIQSDLKTKKSFVDDLLADFHNENEAESADWAFSGTSASSNPFDPFASNETTHESGQHEPPINVDSLFSSHTPLSASLSTSDLNSAKFTPVHQSASYASLSSTSPASKSTRTADPFADLSDLFGGRSRDATDPSVAADKTVSGDRTRPGQTSPQPSNRGSAPNVNLGSEFSTTSSGARPRVEKDAFSDLLGEFGTKSSSTSQPLTVNDMRRQKLEKTTDPDQLKVLDWAHGKDRNVRALLCSLPSILWTGVRWKPVSIADLMTPDQVKRQYRNAARAVHPDKWINTENENLARMIFVELNDAMSEFEKEPPSNISF